MDILPKNNKNSTAKTKPVITLMFVDVVESGVTKRTAEQDADVVTTILEDIQLRYLRLVRRAVAEHHGEEMMTIGSTFFLTFERQSDAIRCATDIQLAMSDKPIDTPSGPMQLSIGIHIGAPEYFENSWHGTDVDIAARAQSAGLPGQIVVTEVARESMEDHLDIRFRPLGTFALKGVGDVKLWDAGYNRHKLCRAAITSIEQRRKRRIATSIAFILGAIILMSGAGQRWRQDGVAVVLASAANQFVADLENRNSATMTDTSTDGFTVKLEQLPVSNLMN